MPRKISRRKFLSLSATALAGTTVASSSFLHARSLSTKRLDIRSPKAPGDFSLKIAFLTDIHWRHNFSPKNLLEEASRICAAFNPDILLLGGDYICHHEHEFPPLLEILKSFSAPLGMFAIPGNHDRIYLSVPQIAAYFQSIGFSLISNSGLTLKTPAGHPFHLSGLDSVCKGYPAPKAALAQAPPNIPSLMLCHEPDYWDTILANANRDQYSPPCLVLSGHTHGGQCRIPFVDWTPITVSCGKKYVRGQFQQADSTLYVSNGIGCSGVGFTLVPMRLACPPELTLIHWHG